MAGNPLKVTGPDDRRTIVCVHCNQAMEVGARALSAPCRHCGKPLLFEDIVITNHALKKSVIDTYGSIVVEKKGTCNADRIRCGSMVARGKVNGHVTCHGPLHVGPQGGIKGDVTAPTLAVEAGAVLEGKYRIGS